MCDAIASKNTCKTFSTKFFDWRIQSKSRVFFGWILAGSVSRNSQSKKFSRKSPFSNAKESTIWASVEKGRFRLTNPTA